VTFLLDHDVPDAVGRVAAQAGHTVARLRELLSREADDSTVLAFACGQQAVLVTCNRDHFLALAADRPHPGIVIVIRRQSRVSECSRFLKLLHIAGESGIRNNINFA
jgi:predicted nuclease of predicted toxin-antitoxin system